MIYCEKHSKGQAIVKHINGGALPDIIELWQSLEEINFPKENGRENASSNVHDFENVFELLRW